VGSWKAFFRWLGGGAGLRCDMAGACVGVIDDPERVDVGWDARRVVCPGLIAMSMLGSRHE